MKLSKLFGSIVIATGLVGVSSVALADAASWNGGGNTTFGVVNYTTGHVQSVSVTTYAGTGGSGGTLQNHQFTSISPNGGQQTFNFNTNAKSFYACVQYTQGGTCWPVNVGGSTKGDGITNIPADTTINNAGIKIYTGSNTK